MTSPDVIPLEEAAARLGVSLATLYREFRAVDATGRIRAARFGGDRLGQRCIIRRAPFERYLAGTESAAVPTPERNPFIRDITRAS